LFAPNKNCHWALRQACSRLRSVRKHPGVCVCSYCTSTIAGFHCEACSHSCHATAGRLTQFPYACRERVRSAEENSPACDHACEAELRAELGFGPEREAEFRNQLTLARHDISYDRVWTSNLQDALQAATEYCDIQRQVDKIVGKGAVSQYTRNDVHSRFAERENKLKSQYRNAAGLLTQHLEAVQRFAPFRATVMQYQRNGAAAHACPDYSLP